MRRATPRPRADGRRPDPLDLAGLGVDPLQRAAADRLAPEPRDDEQPRRRREILRRRREVVRRVVACVKALGEFAKIGFETPPRVDASRRLDGDRHRGRVEEPFDLAHRRHEAGAPGLVERRDERGGEPVGERVIGGDLGPARSGEARAAPARVRRVRVDRDQALAFERPQEAAQIAGIEAEPGAQGFGVGALRADLEQDPRLAERPAALEIALIERADRLGDGAVEAANAADRLGIHSLTLVRDRLGARGESDPHCVTRWL